MRRPWPTGGLLSRGKKTDWFFFFKNAYLNRNIKADLPTVFQADMRNFINVIFYPSAEICRLTDRRVTMSTALRRDKNH